MQVLHKKPEFSKEGARVSLCLIHPKPLPVSLSPRFCTKLPTKDHNEASMSHASLRSMLDLVMLQLNDSYITAKFYSHVDNECVYN